METSNQSLHKYLDSFLDRFNKILLIVGYDEIGAGEYIKRFINIAESKVIQRIIVRLPLDVQNETLTMFSSLNDSSVINNSAMDQKIDRFQEIIQKYISPNEFKILFVEVHDDLFKGYLDAVIPTLTEDQITSLKAISD